MASTAAPDYPQVRWDLSALFDDIEDPKIEQTIAQLHHLADAFGEKYRGKINDLNVTASLLLDATQNAERIYNELSKVIDFAYLVFSTNTGDPKLGAFLQKAMEWASELQVKMMFFELEIQALPQDKADALMEDPTLAGYRHYLQKARLMSPYRLSEREEVILEKTANVGTRAWVRLHDEVTSNHTFKLKRPGSDDIEELTQTEVLDLLRSPDRALRQAAADAFSNGLQEIERVVTFTFNTLLLDRKIDDELRKFESPDAHRHLSNELDKETVELVIGKCEQNYGLVERFYNLKRQILNLPELTHIDRYAPLFDTKEKVEWNRAKTIVLDAFGRFSTDLRYLAEEFFDKKWIDAEPRPGKTGGAFCSGNTPDTHPVMLMSYMNKMDDVMTLAHELGHGVHASLSRKQSLFNYQPTLPMAELASTFAEMLVFESLVEKADRKDKLALYAEKIEGIFATIFRQAAMFRFEQKCHKLRREQGELSAEEIGEVWQETIQQMFGTSIKLGEQHKCWWEYVSHFFAVPFYVYAYSFGELLVLALYQRAKDEGPAFAEKYREMLSLGGSVTPHEQMQVVGVDLQDPGFWDGGFKVLDGLVSEFERLWAEENAS